MWIACSSGGNDMQVLLYCNLELICCISYLQRYNKNANYERKNSGTTKTKNDIQSHTLKAIDQGHFYFYLATGFFCQYCVKEFLMFFRRKSVQIQENADQK